MGDTLQVEVVYLFDDHTWDTRVIDIPKEVAEKQSHDAFAEWFFSSEGDHFRAGLSPRTNGVFVMTWNSILVELGDLRLRPNPLDQRTYRRTVTLEPTPERLVQKGREKLLAMARSDKPWVRVEISRAVRERGIEPFVWLTWDAEKRVDFLLDPRGELEVTTVSATPPGPEWELVE